MRKLALMFFLLFAASTVLAQAGIKARKKPQLKLPMISFGLYGSSGFGLNSEISNTIQAYNNAGRETGNLATAAKRSNLYGGGGAQIRHFFHWLDFDYLGLQASGDFHFFENGQVGFNTAGDPKQETIYDFKSRNMITVNVAAIATIYRAAKFATHVGLGGLYSIEKLTFSETLPTGTSTDAKLKGKGFGFNAFFAFDYKIGRNFNLFAEVHARILTITKLEGSTDNGDVVLQNETLSGVTNEPNTVLRTASTTDPNKLSWSQGGAQIKVGTYFYLN